MTRFVFCVAFAAVFVGGSARADYIDHFAAKDDVGVFKIPSRGDTRVLVIPVIVDDLPFAEGDEAAFLDDVADFYADGDVVDVDGKFRFTTWYQQASLGRFHPHVDVAAPVHFPSCPTLGAHEDCEIPRGAGITDGDLAGAVSTLKDAMGFMNEIFLCASDGPSAERLCTSGGGVDFADYDTSGNVEGVADGFVDGVILISNAGFPGIALPVKDLSTQRILAFAGPFPDFVYDGVTVPSVAIAGRTARPGRETFVSVHEFGHLMGFCDLYNESGATDDLPYTLMGGWFYSTPASLLDPFSRLAIGWGNVTQVSGPGTFTLKTAATSGEILKVGDGDEFFLIEHRKKRADTLDGDLSIDSGVFVERVRLAKRPSATPGNYFTTLQNCVDCTPFDSLLMAEEADGDYDLQKGRGRDDSTALFQSGDTFAPSGDTAPRSLAHPVFSTNLLSGAPTGITVTTDSVDNDGATVTIDAPAVADPCAALADLCTGDCVVDGGHARCGDFGEFPASVVGDVEDVIDSGCACAASSKDGNEGAFVGFAVVLVTVRRRGKRPMPR